MDDVCETLFEPVRSGAVALAGRRVLFLNAQSDALLNDQVILQQGFKPYADALGRASQPEIPEDGEFDVILHLFPKNITEGIYQLARGLALLRAGGVYVCAAQNKAGGARLKKILAGFGFSDVQDVSKNKCRVVWAVKTSGLRQDDLARALADGAEQAVMGGNFISQPGIFGWDKIDRGSALLVSHLPDHFAGQGADFGCGYGYLSREVLTKSKAIVKLTCMDADYRAVSVCRKNLAAFEDRADFLWCDLTTPQGLSDLDFIVMNPPFHEGKKTDVGVGADFILRASQGLKAGGVLWMVANTHLPYEQVLGRVFRDVKMVADQQGFKVFRAVKG